MPSKKYNNGRRREKAEGESDILGIVLVILSAFILLCIIVRPILGVISKLIYGVTTGIFGIFSYPLFFSTLILGIALIQGRKASLATRYKLGIVFMALSLMIILQLATTHSMLGETFSSYVSGVYSAKLTAGGVLFGVVAYAVQRLITPVVSYIVFSLLFIAAFTFFIALPLYGKRKNDKRAQTPEQANNSFVKGQAAPMPIRPITDNTLYVAQIVPTQQNRLIAEQTPLGENYELPQKTQTPAINSAASNSSLSQFEPYSKAPKQTERSKAYETLFGNRQQYAPLPKPTPIDFNDAEKEYLSKFVLPPLTAEPTVKDNTVQQQPKAPVEQQPKPQQRVHAPELPEVPMVPPKDFSEQIVGGAGIINGEILSRQLEESNAPIKSEKDNSELPKAGAFSTKKLEPAAIRPKESTEAEEEYEEQPAIVNGDYFGAPAKQSNASAAKTPSFTNSVKEKKQQQKPFAPLFEPPLKGFDDFSNASSQEDENDYLEPIITASEYEKQHTPESRFQQLLNEERERAAATENKSKREPDLFQRNDSAEPAQNGFEQSAEPFIELPSEEDESLIADVDDLPIEPQEPVTESSFKIIEEPLDLSEQSHFDGNDNTGYYEPVSFSSKPPKTQEQPVVRSTNQLKIDDYVAVAPQPPVKPKKKKHSRYNPPDIDMLISSDASIPENFNVACEEKARILEETLQELKLPVKVTGITRGPAVTRFELEMPPGISIKRIEQFSTDIEYNLASNGKIRIEAPIPGKRAVGIEVPNEEIDIVRLREVISAKEFHGSSSPLTLALGKDIAGSIIVCNLEKMPHLLIAGATGSGKSACLNSIIISILYKSSPEDVRLILIDPKRVEFNMYQGIPHLLGADIINDAQQAINVLTWAKEEMDRRYTLFGNHRVRSLPEFNKSEAVKSGEEQKLPYIVLIVDELAELMLDNNKKILESKIMSIAQKARAAGIHLILATQRPSVDVITGTIKANLPSRIAFTVKSNMDSRTILDEGGAETLLGRGDMLYSPVGMDEPKRVQGAFVTDDEVMAISEYVRVNNEADFDEEFTSAIEVKPVESDSDDDDEEDSKEFDSLMPEVLKCVIESGSASTSMIQRRFSVGYARASRIIDQMEQHKFIGPLEGSKPRAVYISREQYKELFGIEI